MTNPTAVSAYSDENITANDIIVSCGDKAKILHVSELFVFEVYSSEYQYITASRSEQVIDNAIVMVTSDVTTKAAMISDNSSKEYEYFVKTLEENNYEVTEMSLEKDEFSDADMVIIYEPEQDFSDDALLKLQDFLSNGENYGKNLLYIPDINGAEHPRLDNFISMFGISAGSGIAFEYDDSQRYYQDNYYEYIICGFGSDLYRQNISEKIYTPVMTGVSRPVNIQSGYAEPLLILSEKSGILPYDADEKWSMEDSITGNVCIMAQSSVGDDNNKSTLVIAGSSELFSEKYFVSSLGNRSYIMNMLAQLNGRSDEIISVSEKVITSFDISADARTRFWIGFVIYAVLPLMILGCGLTVYLVRRGK